MRWLVATIGLVAGCGDLLGLDTVEAPPAVFVPAFVHSNSIVGVTTKELDVSLPFAARGDLIVVAVCFDTGAMITSVSDVDTPAYTELSNKSAVGVLQAVVYWGQVATTTQAPFEVRVLFKDFVGSPDVRVAEYSHVRFPNPVENAGDTQGADVTSIPLDIVISPAPAVVVAATCVGAQTLDITTGFKIHEMTAPNGDALGDLIVENSGRITATASQSGDGDALIFQLVAFAGGTSP